MTDALIDLSPMWSAVTGIVAHYSVPLLAMLGVYIGLFLVGLVFEAVRTTRRGPDV